MKLLLSILAFAAYADANAQFYVGAEAAARYDLQQRQRTEYLDIQREALGLQREALRLAREALEQHRRAQWAGQTYYECLTTRHYSQCGNPWEHKQ